MLRFVGDRKTTEPAEENAVGSKRTRWVRAMVDRVPTKWASAIGVGLFLAATAAFGGLNAVADPTTPEVGIDDQVLTSNLDMTVRSVFLSDRVVGGASADKENGERVLAVRIEVTNLFEEYRLVGGLPGFQATRIVGGPDKTPDASRPGERHGSALMLQPGVADEIILSWTVDAEDYREGDEVRISLSDPQPYRGQFLDRELHWAEEGPSAFVTATLEDLGEGDPW